MPNKRSGTMSLDEIRDGMGLTADDDLVEACRRHERMYRAASTMEVEAQMEHMRAVAKQKVYAARLELAIRSDPVSYQLKDKPNEGEIKAAIVVDEQNREKEQAVRDAHFAWDMVKALVSQVIERRRAIELMLEAMWHETNATPKPRTPASAAVSERIGAGAARSGVNGPKRKSE